MPARNDPIGPNLITVPLRHVLSIVVENMARHPARPAAKDRHAPGQRSGLPCAPVPQAVRSLAGPRSAGWFQREDTVQDPQRPPPLPDAFLGQVAGAELCPANRAHAAFANVVLVVR